MDATNIASIIISLIAAGSAIASQRQAAKASTTNAQTTSRATAETESYTRARKMDIETIERQDEEIAELRAENKQYRADNQELEDEVVMLRKRVSRLEPEEEVASEV